MTYAKLVKCGVFSYIKKGANVESTIVELLSMLKLKRSAKMIQLISAMANFRNRL